MNRIHLIISIIIITSMTLLWSGSLQAKKKGKKRKASINFEDELIHGDVKNTDLLYLLKRKQFNYKKLIKLRKNFLPEMRRSAEEIRRAKG